MKLEKLEKLNKISHDFAKLIANLYREIELRKQMQIEIIIRGFFPEHYKEGHFMIVNAYYYKRNCRPVFMDQGLKIEGYRVPMNMEANEELKNTTIVYCKEDKTFVEIPQLNMGYDIKHVWYKR